MPSVQLPLSLREALSDLADRLPGKELARAAASLAASERANLPARFDEASVRIAYAVTRMPALYATVSLALNELPFQPASVLILGSGPGAVAWACAQRWPGDLSLTLVDPNPEWAEVAAEMGAPAAVWIRSDLRKLAPPEPHDLAVASYSPHEFTEKEQSRLLEEAWFMARRALLILAPGNALGFEGIRRMRSWLIDRGGHIQAPCPGNGQCPVPLGDACYFSVRVDRSRAHRMARGGGLGFEDEKFSYVLAMKEPATPTAARIVRPPAIHSHLIDISLCNAKGLERARITKKDKDTWKSARKADWGDRWTG